MLDTYATSSSRMQDVYNTSYYCRLKDEYTTTYSRDLDISAASSSKMQGLKQVAHLRALQSKSSLNKTIAAPKELPLGIGMEVAKELPLNMEMEAAKELPLNMEMEATLMFCMISPYHIPTVLMLLLLRRRHRKEMVTQKAHDGVEDRMFLLTKEMAVPKELLLSIGMEITKELSLTMRMEAAKELPLNMEVKVTKELPLNMEMKVTMEPRREDKRGEKKIKKSRNYVTLLLLCA